jgi:hypothetical protein
MDTLFISNTINPSIRFLTSLDQNLATPATWTSFPTPGAIAYDTTNDILFYGTPTAWLALASANSIAAPIAAIDDNGIVFVGAFLHLEFADSTHNGIVSHVAQQFGGNKTFIDGIQTYTNGITSNVVIGLNAMPTPTGTGNIAIGAAALQPDTTGSSNTAVGFQALAANTTGNNNSAFGFQALLSNTTASNNTAIGFQTLRANTTGANNVALGSTVLFLNTTGGNNVALGFGALNGNVTGSNNVAMGFGSLTNSTVSDLTAVGHLSLGNNTTGTNNTALGNRAILNNTSGANNTAVGASALLNLATGANNIAVGVSSGIALVGAESNNIYIGNLGVAAESATIRLGTLGTQTRNFQAGIRGIVTGVADAIAVLIDSTGQLGTVSSSKSLKENIAPLGNVKDIIAKLEPSRFSFKDDPSSKLSYGLIAEDVLKVIPDIVVPLNTGEDNLLTIQYQHIPLL